MTAAALVAAVLLVSLVIAVGGVLWRLRQWLGTPQPWPVPITPAPAGTGGVLLRLLRETLLFESLWRASRWTWTLGWTLHLMLLLAFLGHLRFATEPWWPALPDTSRLADAVGVLMMLALAGLWVRRLLVDRVRHISQASDYLWLALLFGIAGSGSWMGHAAGLEVREFVWGLPAGELRPLPDSVAAVAHLLLVSLLLALFPFGKLLHGPALFVNPTRVQADRARRPAAGRTGEAR